ncbi:alpha-amylase family glycosyl hydrolase, partial [Mycoplasma leonicaptivi]|uniref:alpha-amylase family glycosyl hydrolase n=1 Tax=Mycoplasma leonicaptivi TaxID=36742 RepID=UPI0004899612
MKLYKKSVEFFQRFDKKYPYKKDDLGVKFLRNNIQIKLWQPFAQEIDLLVYDKEDTKKVVEIIPMTKVRYTWVVNIDLSFEGFYYQFKITQSNGDVNLALDPYVISLAPFNWKGQENGVGKGALVNIKSKEAGPKPRQLKSNLNNSVDPYIYELHIRDFTSGLEQDRFKSRLGTFDAAIDHKIFDYLKELNITHLQLLPIQSAYTVNEFDLGIYSKGHGRGWTTNYNWGYDPHNYFSINGIYSSDPQNPYARIKEFRNFISKAHQKGIAVIIDVVYNHMMTNTILNNVLPGYYYRNLAKQFPVNYPPLADERYMVRKLMIDSLKYFVKEFRVDGFRFDLSCFHHFETIDEIAKELREINPNIILHGEAWPFSDLEHSKSYIKGVRGNNINFGYFNDTLRDAIKGSEHEGYFKGLIHEFSEESFKKYVSSIVGNIKDYDFKGVSHANDTYSLFADNIGMNLAYSACHDGMTLWDKLNILL